MTSQLNIPNLISLLRIFLIPVMVVIFYTNINSKHIICALIFGFAAITDWLDGYLARKLNQSSKFGAFIDPVADKLIVVIALILLLSKHPYLWFVIPTIIIISREIVISALREWVAQIGARSNLAVVKMGKYKTTVQMLAIFMLLLFNPESNTYFQESLYIMGSILLYIAALLTVWSMIIYLKLAWQDLF